MACKRGRWLVKRGRWLVKRGRWLVSGGRWLVKEVDISSECSLNMDILFGLLPPATEVLGKVIFSEACVKNSVHGGGFCLSACWDTTHPPSKYPTPEQAPPEQAHPPRTRHPLRADTPQDQTPPEQAPPQAEHAGRYGQ